MKLIKEKVEGLGDNYILEEYSFYSLYGDLEHKPIGLHFLCRGCNKLVSIEIPRWNIDFNNLTVTPSILHDPQKGGCGWHGYLTNGEFKLA